MNTAVFTAGACRYLLRNGQFINASVRVPDQDLVVYVQMDGTVIHALTSAKAEHLLIQSIKASAAPTSANGTAVTPVSLPSRQQLDSTCCRAITVTALTPPRHHVRSRTTAT